MDQTRISLRPFNLSDADDFFSRLPYPTRGAGRSASTTGQSGTFSIKPESGSDRHRAHVGYAVAAEYWGQGIVTVALKLAVVRVFEEFPYLVRLEALVEEENKGSQRVLEKVGFQKEGFLRKYGFNKGQIRDMFIYSFLSTDKAM
ncbi:acyl-CoA N-acyltransferases (NAT) superfamily protein [Actinidia rufa]|uniref:Acyl-CoA N-acyltransferases (NAT) superfamily protein n=1 Tax=Actinidia rufa TaxID=165716 RepID=A0A7J0HFW0_9ERIC|nr:acyl-CoA N-acyltransferases (NAT) superfamily protein [Actinidia rufa]